MKTVIKVSKRGHTRITKTVVSGLTVDILTSSLRHWVTMATESNGDNIKSWFEYYSGEKLPEDFILTKILVPQ